MNIPARAAIAAVAISAALTAQGQILSAKRGYADTSGGYAGLQATNAGWYYTWSPDSPGSPGNYNADFYPMISRSWHATTAQVNNIKRYGAMKYVFGFNEPERADQANMTVDAAFAAWRDVISPGFAGTTTQLVSPSVSDTGGAAGGQAWLSSFMSQVRGASLKIDAVAFHWYGASTPNNPSGAASSFLSRVDSYHASYGLPVFITEFAIHDWGGSYTDEQITEANRQFLDIVLPALESRSHVAGYAFYPWFSDGRLFTGTPATPTPMGYAYAAAIGSGSTANVGGLNLGERVAYLTGGTLTMTGSAGTVRYVSALANTSVVTGSINWGTEASSSWARVQAGATLRKLGTNQITFGGGSVTNDGTIEVADGALRIATVAGGTGSISIPSNGGAIGSTARLELAGSGSIAAAIWLAPRNDPGGSDAIRGVSGTTTITGPITITVGGNQSRIQSDAGLLTVGSITTNASSSRNLYLQGAGNGVVAGAISDNAANAVATINLFKEGVGTWTLSGASTYSGSTTITAGTLRLAAATGTATGPLPATARVSMASGATLDVGSVTQRLASLVSPVGSSLVLSSGSGRLTLGTSGIERLAGVTSGGGALEMAGTGTLILTGSNAHRGGTLVSSGRLVAGNSVALGIGGVTMGGGILTTGTEAGTAISFVNAITTGAGRIEAGDGMTVTLAGSLLGSGSIGLSGSFLASGASAIRLTGNNTGFGGTAAIGGANVRLGTTGAGSAAAHWVVDGNLQTDSAAGGSFQLGALSGTGVISGHANNAVATISTLSIGGRGLDTTFAGRIVNNAAGDAATGNADGARNNVLALRKTGMAALTLAGANLHTGTTTVAGGMLRLEHTDALSQSPVNVLTGAALVVGDRIAARIPAATISGGTFTAPTLLVDGSTGIATLRINAGTLGGSPAITVDRGGAIFASGTYRGTIAAASLVINEAAGGGRFELGGGQLTVAASGITTDDLVADLTAGRGDGMWNGSTGITSSVVAADLANGRPRTLGWIDSGDGSLTVRYAAPGDTNIDDGVDILDAANFLTGGAFDTGLPATWFAGDFNYDDVVDILDAADFFSTGLFDAGPYTAALSLTPVTAVPEPTMLSPWLALAVATVWRLQFRKR